MCGILFIFNKKHFPKPADYSIQWNAPRGPDETKIVIIPPNSFMAFHRLSIVNIKEGMQPFERKSLYSMCNGEIYHSLYGRKASDCETIIQAYEDGIEPIVFTPKLLGEFAYILFDTKNSHVYFARDSFGIKPLYIVNNANYFALSSTAGSIMNLGEVKQVEPRKVFLYNTKKSTLTGMTYTIVTFHSPRHPIAYLEPDAPYKFIASELRIAIERRITHSERPVGFLLSGGLDSSVVLAISLASGLLKHPPKVFTFGFSHDAPDVLAASQVVEWLRNLHGKDSFEWNLVIGDINEGLDALPDVIRSIETYDTTTVRASTPMYLISRWIRKNTDVKVILSGEGSDELFGGYLYFMYAPSEFEFKAEIVKLLNNLHYFDVLRADRTTAAFGLEFRPPFLDTELIQAVMTHRVQFASDLNTKYILRRAIKTSYPVSLPPNIIDGKKEAFSDAVGYSWKDTLGRMAREKYPASANPELTYYKAIYDSIFKSPVDPFPYLWLPNKDWVDTGNEPSARALSIYGKKMEVIE